MARDWNVTFESWGAAPGITETQKCGNAERAVRKAIDACPKLSSMPIEVFTQGSYRNGTNVRQDSDVDVCVLYKAAFFNHYQFAEGLSKEALGYTTSTYLYPEFKNDVGSALIDYFGREFVTRGSKAFDIHKNTYRIDADVVPTMEHRLYTGNIHSYSWLSGTELHPDKGGEIVNWPQQNYNNGCTKDYASGEQFKTITRILKRMRYELIDEGHEVAVRIPSFLIECLVYSVPNDQLNVGSLRQNVRSVLVYLWNGTETQAACNDWVEVNDRKYLFRASQPWKREDVRAFVQAAWDYVGFE